VLLKIVYLLTCRVLGLAVLVFRSGLSRDQLTALTEVTSCVLERLQATESAR
jgi:hypothetical protein